MSDKSEIVFIPNGREKIRCTAEGKTFFYTDETEARMSDDLVKCMMENPVQKKETHND